MIFPAAGLPGRFAEWCESLLAALVAATGQQADIFNADSLGALGSALLVRAQTCAIMVSRQPDAELTQRLKTQPRPFMVTVERPDACVAALMQDHGLSFLEAVRSTANACTAILPLMEAPGALVLRAEDRQDPPTIANAIATHYRLDLDEGVVARVAKDLGGRFAALGAIAAPRQHPSPTQAGPLDAGHLLPPVLDGALSPLWAALNADALTDIIWHRDLFFSGDHSGQPPAAAIDVTGPNRCLFYGPYIRLPAGSWSCALMLGFGPDAIGLTLVAEIAAGPVLSRVEFEVGETGFFEIEFSCVLTNADRPLEIRLFNGRAAFEGHIALVRAQMRPLKAVRIPVKLA